MTGKLKLLCNKIKERVLNGEAVDEVIASYSFLTDAEIEEIKAEIV